MCQNLFLFKATNIIKLTKVLENIHENEFKQKFEEKIKIERKNVIIRLKCNLGVNKEISSYFPLLYFLQFGLNLMF